MSVKSAKTGAKPAGPISGKSKAEAAAEEKIRAVSDYGRTLIESSLDPLSTISADGRLMDVNAATEAATGYSRKELIGTEFSQYFTEPEKARAVHKRALQEGFLRDVELAVRRRDGHVAPMLFNASVYRDEGGEVAGVFVAARDITALKRAEAELHQSRERLAVTLRSIGDGVIATDIEGRVELLNQAAESLTGWVQEEARGRPLEEVFMAVDERSREPRLNLLERVLKDREIVELGEHAVLISRDKVEHIITDSISPIIGKTGEVQGAVLAFRDMTEKRRISGELEMAQRLESLGALAGGIAHDFNNMLMSTLGNLSLMKLEIDPRAELFSHLIAAEKGVGKARELTQQLLTFSRGNKPVKQVTHVSQLIEESCNFALRGSRCKCEFALAPGLWPVEVDPGQISQVINNLLINADQAMPGGGYVTVGAENVTLDAGNPAGLPAGKYVKVTVKDQGIGIPREYLSRIFDPFFTTKQGGAGLGLSISYSIIRKHDGHIEVKSSPGKGAAFFIYLPASEKAVRPPSAEELAVHKGTGRILVMDDEETVREIAEKMIKKLGYEPEFARDGSEALEMYIKAEDQGRPFDAVILDLTIAGGMGGKDAINRLLDIDPNAKAIVSSGYSTDPIVSDPQKFGFRATIIKPYEINTLGKILCEVLSK